ncbi:MAG: hypothetical protein ABEI99_08730 [Halobaculum sp.]
MEVARPSIPDSLLTGWRETESSVKKLFDARVVSVHAHTVVYEDADLREQLRSETGIDHQWRFAVAARLALRPRTEPSGPLTSLVADRAHDGFADRLADRGLTGIRQTGETEREIDGETAREASYEALCRLDTVSVRTTGRVAVRPTEDAYLLVGGAYPTAVRSGTDEATVDAVEARLDTDRFDSELDELIAGVE